MDALIGCDLGRAIPSLQGFQLALNASNMLDKRDVTACPFNNSCYFGASRSVTGDGALRLMIAAAVRDPNWMAPITLPAVWPLLNISRSQRICGSG